MSSHFYQAKQQYHKGSGKVLPSRSFAKTRLSSVEEQTMVGRRAVCSGSDECVRWPLCLQEKLRGGVSA